MLERLRRDILYAARGIRQSPIFAATSIIILALSIGGNTAMFTVIRAVLLRPLNYRDPNQLVWISGGATPTRFEEMKTADALAGIACFALAENLTLAGTADPETVTGARVSANFFELLGVAPLLGNGFRLADDSPGAAGVVMISSEMWQRHFGRSQHIVGQTVTLSATPYTIAGVIPPRIQLPFPGVDVWMTRPSEWPLMPAESRRLSPFLSVIGRLKPGWSLAQANAEMMVIHRRYALAHPAMLDAKPKSPEELTSMKEHIVGNSRATLLMLYGAVSFVLIIACANLAGLFLVRAGARSREFAVRSALGAPRARLISQLLTESMLLSLVGGLIGVFLAALSLRTIPGIAALELPRTGEIGFDWVVLVYASLLSVGSGVLFGLAPSLNSCRTDLMQVLRGSGVTAGEGTRTTGRGLLVIGQIALSVVLLIGAALLLESVAHLRHSDLGFNAANLLTLRISLPPGRYDSEQKQASFFRDLAQRVASLPGVRSATTAMFLPMTGSIGSPVQDAGKPPLRLNERPIATILIVAPDYFRTLDIPIRRGREFLEQDTARAQRVAIINETAARRFWPGYPTGLNPIGQHLLIGGVNPHPVEIVGIVPDVRQNLEDSSWRDTIYLSFAQNPQSSAMLAIKTGGDALQVANAVRRQVRVLDASQPVLAVQTMEELVDRESGDRQLVLRLLGSFAGIALLLALVGIYGAMSYSVTHRVREMGIRSALGARPGQLLGLVMRQGFYLTLAGIAAGVSGALFLTRIMKSLLYGVSAIDPLTFAGIGLLFALMALAATYLPARRATKIDPVAALRL
jgi:predicted permease